MILYRSYRAWQWLVSVYLLIFGHAVAEYIQDLLFFIKLHREGSLLFVLINSLALQRILLRAYLLCLLICGQAVDEVA